MAKLIIDEEEIELPDNSKIASACQEEGVPFGCLSGACQSCKMKVIEGMENLTEMTEAEKFAKLPKEQRLVCQCTIKKGTVKLEFPY